MKWGWDEIVIILIFIIAGYFLLNRKTAIVAAVAPNDAQLAARLWTSIGQPGAPGVRFQKRNIVTVTGTVVGKTPHYNRDGDLVFGLMPDPQFKHLLTGKASEIHKTISGGGIWCEAVCQKPNTSPEPVHLGDCAKGGPFPMFPMPKMGERWSVTGLHIIDVREGGHSEVHPVTRMSKI